MNKEDFNNYFELLPRQNWLTEKEEQMINLISSCKNKEQKKLIFELLEDFRYVDYKLFNRYLENIADYIINDSGFEIENTQIVGMVMDSNPDSSQWILQLLKPILTKKGWNNVKITPEFHRAVRKMNREGLTNLILIDEFIGSGQSVDGRLNYLEEKAKTEYKINACFLAGMENGINKVKSRFNDFKCLIPLKKGISDKYQSPLKEKAIQNMLDLENQLLPLINKKKLADYSFGFGKVEALYSSHGNAPNSVFPFFWWPYDIKKEFRNSLLIRNEDGLGL
jgi:hypothetical protein